MSREEWLAARKELLVKEKELTRARDRVNADRRRLPMVRIDKPYTFEGPDGTVGLLDLFEGRSQLVMHHFMWIFDIDAEGAEHPRDTGCSSCSSTADGIGKLRQLNVRNTTLVAVTRAPYETLAAFRERMGWTFPWYSSYGSDFNYDFHATVDDRVAPVQIFHRTEAELAAAGMPFDDSMRGDWPGLSAFLRVGDEVFHTYSTFGRGIEEFHNGYHYLDLTALGRQEAWEEPTGRATPLGPHVGGPQHAPPRRIRHVTRWPAIAHPADWAAPRFLDRGLCGAGGLLVVQELNADFRENGLIKEYALEVGNGEENH